MSETAAIRPAARHALATGRRVRGRLAEAQASQEQAARALGLSQAAIARRLSGQVDFTISELLDLAEWLDCDLSELLPRGARLRGVPSAQSCSPFETSTAGDELARARHRRNRDDTLPLLPRPIIGRLPRHLHLVARTA